MFDKILVREEGSIKQIAGMKDGDLREFVVIDSNKANEGNIYLGKIVKKIQTANGYSGYFVNIGGDKEAFINAEERKLESLNACEGQSIIVQVLQEQRAEKGARVTRFLQIVGTFLVYSPYGEDILVSAKIDDEEKREELGNLIADNVDQGGWMVRTQALDAQKEDILKELKILQSVFNNILIRVKNLKAPALLFTNDNYLDEMIKRSQSCSLKIEVNSHILEKELSDKAVVLFNAKAFEEAGVEEKINNALSKNVKLNCGGRVIIEETKAFVAIDVDSGEGFTQGGINRLNQEAAHEIVRQILLRNLSGKIIIDFAGNNEFKFLKSVIDILVKGLAQDVSKAKVLGVSRAGNVEIVRSRKRPSLRDLFSEECVTCQGTGRVEK